MYEPYNFTSGHNFQKKLKLSYPGYVPFGQENKNIFWDKKAIQKYFAPFEKWVQENAIPSNRIVAGEFGCMRRNKGCTAYMKDLLSYFQNKKYHWAFYAFRELAWDGYDYELWNKGFNWQYWKDLDAGKTPKKPYDQRKNNPLWKVINDALNAPR